MKRVKTIYIALFAILGFGILQFGISRIYGPILFPDEFGYWAAAATMKGYDWSEISSLGSYYSYGYGILLYPLLSWIDNPVTLYRAAIYVNFFLLCMAFAVLYKILKKLFFEVEERLLFFLCMGGIFYCSWIFFMQVTLSEIFLMTLYLFLLFILLHYLENPKGITACCLAGVFVLLYFVHMRMVGTLIAGGLLFLWLAFCPKYRKSVLCMGMTAGVLLAAGYLLQKGLLDTLYQSVPPENLQINYYTGQWGKFASLLTWEGFKDLILSCIGKLFYLGIATFGLFYWGMYFLIKKSFLFVKTKGKQNVFFIFILVSVLGQFAVSAIYMMGGRRMDTLIYGRYNEIVLPILICFGFYELLHLKCAIRKTLLITVIQAVFAVIVTGVWSHPDTYLEHACFIVGVNYAVDRWNFDSRSFLWIVLLVGSLLYFLTAFLMMRVRKKQGQYWLIGVLVFLQIGIGLQASEDYVYFHNQLNYTDVLLGEELKELAGSKREVYFADSHESAEYIQLLQFCFREKSIHVLTKEEQAKRELKKDAILVSYWSNEGNAAFEKEYEEKIESTHFDVYYN